MVNVALCGIAALFDGGVSGSANTGVAMQYSQKRIIADVLSVHDAEHVRNDIRTWMQQKFDESLSSAIYGTCTATDTNAGNMTGASILEALAELREELIPIVWYASSKHIERGKAFSLPKTDWNPEFWIVNDDDVDEFVVKVVEGGGLPKELREWHGAKRLPKLGMISA